MGNQANREGPLHLVMAQCCLCEIDNGDPIATGEDFEYRVTQDTFVAVRCRRCGLVYLNRRPADDELDRIYPADYHAFQFSPEKFGLVHRVRRRLEARRLLKLCAVLPANARILDVGCGDGFHLGLLREFGKPGWVLEGIDLSERAVAAARRAALHVKLGEIENPHLPDAAYHLILLIATIEHVGNPVSVLRAAARLLRPGGRVLIVTDNTATLDFRLWSRRHWGGYHFPRHWNLFNLETLRKLAGKASLEVESLQTIVSPVNWVFSIRNLLVDRGAPSWLVNRFSLKTPVTLGIFTLVDAACQMAGHGALARLIARRPE